ncbi:PEPxxWA-CTERM sorting domain-containing protein [Sphingomonas rubra]|uniref:PEP-CTERM protein-sorting domain-containing protein n=1 Tax=Sphingomonas rubra TaxID=634430 RepID=A0A1I5PRT4_9SPHN|nr:PEPxxWA-CTERM sorting domain-containing protein [Sphingomonas rubra]SFP36231.1 PEP-CTERM protein-sorting domain-containing protein [Sphingomonas rubra]
MTIRFLASAIGAVLLATPAGAATVLDFNELHPTRGRTYVYGPYEQAGFRLSSSACPIAGTNGRAQCFVTPANTINNIDRVGAALVNFAGNAVVSLAKVDGGLFTLDSLVLASNINNASGLGRATQDASFTFMLADGSTLTRTRTIDSTGVANRNLLTFDVGPLTGFSFRPSTGTGGFLQFDDIAVTAVAAVPEASIWAMMLVGFGGIGVALRRRRSKVTGRVAFAA